MTRFKSGLCLAAWLLITGHPAGGALPERDPEALVARLCGAEEPNLGKEPALASVPTSSEGDLAQVAHHGVPESSLMAGSSSSKVDERTMDVSLKSDVEKHKEAKLASNRFGRKLYEALALWLRTLDMMATPEGQKVCEEEIKFCLDQVYGNKKIFSQPKRLQKVFSLLGLDKNLRHDSFGSKLDQLLGKLKGKDVGEHLNTGPPPRSQDWIVPTYEFFQGATPCYFFTHTISMALVEETSEQQRKDYIVEIANLLHKLLDTTYISWLITHLDRNVDLRAARKELRAAHQEKILKVSLESLKELVRDRVNVYESLMRKVWYQAATPDAKECHGLASITWNRLCKGPI